MLDCHGIKYPHFPVPSCLIRSYFYPQEEDEPAPPPKKAGGGGMSMMEEMMAKQRARKKVGEVVPFRHLDIWDMYTM